MTIRYTRKTFPPYRHRLGCTPHPKRHPDGHLYGTREAVPEPFEPTRWMDSAEYLEGVDLYNHGYYWEAHEVWESIWKGCDRTRNRALFLQALIQISASMLKREQGVFRGVTKLSLAGVSKLRIVRRASSYFAGVDLDDFIDRVEAVGREPARAGSTPPPIHLRGLQGQEK